MRKPKKRKKPNKPKKPLILCVEDEPEVLAALVRDLEPFTPGFQIESTEDAAEAEEVIQEALGADQPLALALVDHLLPGVLGVDLLASLHANPATASARRVLVTGQAGHADTVRAINEAKIDHYIAKPWEVEELRAVVREQLTTFVIDALEDPLPFVPMLDSPRLMDAVRARRSDT